MGILNLYPTVNHTAVSVDFRFSNSGGRHVTAVTPRTLTILKTVSESELKNCEDD